MARLRGSLVISRPGRERTRTSSQAGGSARPTFDGPNDPARRHRCAARSNDVELTIADGMLRISAERRIENRTEDEGYLRHELRYGSTARTLPRPEGVSESDITATYTDGILEIRIPVPENTRTDPTKIEVKKG